MPRPRFVTLTTDIGWAYAAQMKAVLARSAPRAIVVDVTHEVPRHAVREAAFLLAHLAPQFPPGTVHVGVVDPGVGGARAPVAVATRDGSALVGPDNGLLALAAQRLGERATVRLDPWRLAPGGRSSATFEGRDVFAPAAAALARGVRLASLGRPTTLTPLDWPAPTVCPGSAEGEVVHVDRFGNAITNVPAAAARGASGARVRPGARRVLRLAVRRTYEEVPPGSGLVLGSSFGLLEIAVREGSAAARFGLAPGQPVRFTWEPAATGRRRANSPDR